MPEDEDTDASTEARLKAGEIRHRLMMWPIRAGFTVVPPLRKAPTPHFEYFSALSPDDARLVAIERGQVTLDRWEQILADTPVDVKDDPEQLLDHLVEVFRRGHGGSRTPQTDP